MCDDPKPGMTITPLHVRMRGIRTRAGALISAEVVKLVDRKDSARHSSCANSFAAKFARARTVSRGAAYHLPLLLGDSAQSHHREHPQDSPICMRVCRLDKIARRTEWTRNSFVPTSSRMAILPSSRLLNN